MTVDAAEVERCLATGDLPRALQLSAALLAARPGDAEALVLHAAALMAKGEWLVAAGQLEQALATPEPPYVAKPRLALCRAKLGDRAGALDALRLALAERPGDFLQRLAYAETLESAGDAENALPEYFRAVHDAQVNGRWLNDATTPAYLRARVKDAIAAIDGGRQDLYLQVLEPHVAAFGRDAMQRVEEALGVYLGTRPMPTSDPRQRPKFFWMPGLPPTPYFARELFPWYGALEAAAPAIREELQAVLGEGRTLTPFLGPQDGAGAAADDEYLGGDPARRSWDAYFFHRHGERFEAHLAQCPRTAQALTQVPLTVVRDHAPEVLFSVLAPDTHIKPHYGVTNTRVVTHLPLEIPEGDCRLVVGGIEHAWQEGRCVTFDDTFLHEAWNRSGLRRAVMILDVWNPYLTEAECAALKDLVERIGDFNLRAGIR